MPEQRTPQRHRVLKTGTIAFDRATGIDCVVRNVSNTGANLEVASPVGIPDVFTLIIPKDGVTRLCEIAWRSARRVGVRFK